MIMGNATLLAYHPGDRKLTRDQLAMVPCPPGTATHKPIPHIELVNSVLDGLAMRQINIVSDEYAVSEDGMRMFGIMDLAASAGDFRFAIGLRNSNNKSMALGLIAGFRIFVCSNMAFHGDFEAIVAKHTKRLNILDAIGLGIDRIQRNFKQLQLTVDRWKETQLSDDRAKAIIYDAFIGDQLDAPKHLAKTVHHHYFEPEYQEFEPRTLYSLQNGFTSAFKALEPLPQFRATASLARFFPT
jgi:hypothetical protein